MVTATLKNRVERIAGPLRSSDRFICAALILVLGFEVSGIALQQDLAVRSQKGASHSVQPGAAGLTAQAQAALDRALAALQANSLVDAERFAREAVQAAPNAAITHNVLGVILDRAGRKDEAFAQYDAAIKLDPSFVGARNNLGRFLAENGKRAEAIAEFERVLTIEPGNVQTRYNLGVLYGDTGQYEKAAEHLARARAVAPDDLQLALAFLNVAFRANRIPEAETVADTVERNASR